MKLKITHKNTIIELENKDFSWEWDYSRVLEIIKTSIDKINEDKI